MELQRTLKNIQARALPLTNIDLPTRQALQGFFYRFTEHADLYALAVSQVIGMNQTSIQRHDEFAVYVPPIEMRKNWDKLDYFEHFSQELENVLENLKH